MHLGPKGHLVGLLAIVWTGGVFTQLVIRETLPFSASVAVWIAGIALLFGALFILDRKEDRNSPGPICHIFISLIYLCVSLLLALRMIGYLKEGHYSYLAAILFIGLFVFSAGSHAKKALSEIKK